ncbi:Chemotaxis protein methyltransferase CheR [Candidatus Competibacter denitrificans Run_A_D11]|uniref:Chemotaxis protein methyltransferase n=1 Tax=Candidatus Competibacter denitrificans Run_A_D11 TaxID=1400863 RepID=W6M7L4_9GAMM|nr:protein-glutamate O-methyltransferase [Candidatus Competibacter denitrificans]CDI02564.1 Chemotaxis protein methyltransferase CheR [Candidatus Competibacter denitrificans Run_A_D11]HRC70403.1 protein-glutamate O-methyltransferase [Candidatus Competibacter denitrificans]
MNGEFEFSEQDFQRVRRIIGDIAGISLADGKRELVYSRLSRRLRQRGLQRFEDYCNLLETHEDTDEMGEFVNALTTNLTSFFREAHHFDYLARELLPALVRAGQFGSRRLRIWSAGCSTGEEPYSIAMVVRESLPSVGWNVKILATDLDSNVLATAERGVYDASRIKDLPEARVRRWFQKGRGAQAGQVRVASALRELITFRRLNLMEDWPMRGPFNIVFCRNVVIYFDKPTQRILFDRFANALTEAGHLFVGHSESLFKVTERFAPLGKTIYQRCL